MGSVGILQISVFKTSDFRRQRTDGRSDGRTEILGSAELNPFPKRLTRLTRDHAVLGIQGSGMHNFCPDRLHTWALGPLARWSGYVLWHIMDSNVFEIPGNTPLDLLRHLNVLRLRVELWQFYSLHRKKNRKSQKQLNEIFNLTTKMAGKRRHPELKAKAAECSSMLPFLTDFMRRFRDRFDKRDVVDLLLESGDAAMRFDELLRTSGRTPTHDERRQIFEAYHTHARAYFEAGGRPTPKHHMMYHMVVSIPRTGNPLYTSTYRDETLNHVLGQIARSAHRSQFCLECHRKLHLLEASDKALGGHDL